jgi:hypothetical protein
VPFFFPAVHLRTEGPGLKRTVPAKLALVDRGVYDNLGLESFQGAVLLPLWERMTREDG